MGLRKRSKLLPAIIVVVCVVVSAVCRGDTLPGGEPQLDTSSVEAARDSLTRMLAAKDDKGDEFELKKMVGRTFVNERVDPLGAERLIPIDIDGKTYDELAIVALTADRSGFTGEITTYTKPDDDPDVNAWLGNGQTALMVAADNGNARAVKFLLDAGADVNVMRSTIVLNQPLNALSYASRIGDVEIVTLLLDAGAWIRKVEKPRPGQLELLHDKNALYFARQGGHNDVVKLLYASTGKHRDNELVRAARSGKAEAVKSMLDAGANANAKDTADVTALMTVAGHGKAEAVKLLLDAGANVNAKDKDDMTALIYATLGGAEVVKLLLDAGADVNAKDKHGGTALETARHLDDPEIVKLLLGAGAKDD